MEIRRAGVEDIETVVDLRVAFMREACPGAEVDEAEFREITRSYVADKLPKGEFLVWFAEEAGQMVGMSGLIFYHRPPTINYPSEHQVYLLNMYTLPEWRRRGIATALIQHMIEYVKTTLVKRITLHATDTGRAVYERLGFVPINDEMVLGLE
jgi:GNAT superfamily N-acetyltransferase